MYNNEPNESESTGTLAIRAERVRTNGTETNDVDGEIVVADDEGEILASEVKEDACDVCATLPADSPCPGCYCNRLRQDGTHTHALTLAIEALELVDWRRTEIGAETAAVFARQLVEDQARMRGLSNGV